MTASRWRPTWEASAAFWVPVAAYLAILGVAAAQLLIRDDRWAVASASLPYLLALIIFLVIGSQRPIAPDGPQAYGWVETIAAAGSALGLWLVVGFASALPVAAGHPDGYYRVKVEVTSPLGDHNTAAGLLLVAVVAAAITASRRRRGWVWLMATTLGLVASLSRGAAAVLVVAGVVAWFVTTSRRIATSTSAAGLSALGGVLAFAWALGAAPPPGTVASDGPLGASIVGRLDLALRGLDVARDHPWSGAGFGSFARHTTDLPPPNDHAHQLVTHAAAEGGIIVAIAVVALAAAVMLGAWGLPRSPTRHLALLGGGAMIAHAQIEILGGLTGYEALIAIMLALILRARRPGPDLQGGRAAA